jgi:hypothetical protein
VARPLVLVGGMITSAGAGGGEMALVSSFTDAHTMRRAWPYKVPSSFNSAAAALTLAAPITFTNC